MGYLINGVGKGYWEKAKNMSAIDIINEGYPWEIPFKLAQLLVSHFNLSIEDKRSHLATPCAPFGVIFAAEQTTSKYLLKSFWVSVMYEIEWFGIIYRSDETASWYEGNVFYDLQAPFDKWSWLAFLALVGVAIVIMKCVSSKPVGTTVAALLAPLVDTAVPITFSNSRSQALYSAWLAFCVFIMNAYLSVLNSNVIVPAHESTVKSLDELRGEGYNMIGTTLFSVYPGL